MNMCLKLYVFDKTAYLDKPYTKYKEKTHNPVQENQIRVIFVNRLTPVLSLESQSA